MASLGDDLAGKHSSPPRSPLRFLTVIPSELQNFFQLQLKRLEAARSVGTLAGEDPPTSAFQVDLDKQLRAWKNTPDWSDQCPQFQVVASRGSWFNLNTKFSVALPPDEIYNFLADPGSRQVFKNIKEIRSRRVLVDEGDRQLVEMEQVTTWRFLLFSGTLSVSMIVEQNRGDHTIKFKQSKPGLLKTFEGSWKIDPLFVDDNGYGSARKPLTLSEYYSCTAGEGRVASSVTWDQTIQPGVFCPPPLSWYFREITIRTSQSMVNDLLQESARLRRSGTDDDISCDKRIRIK